MSDARGSRMDSLINRELSLLEFNQRVLALAEDESLPLLERLRFLCISSSNLDEFFEIRVAGLKQLEELGTAVGPQLDQIRASAAQLIGDQYRCLNELLLPELLRAFSNYRMLVYAVVLILVMLATNSPILKNAWAFALRIPAVQELTDKCARIFRNNRKAGDAA